MVRAIAAAVAPLAATIDRLTSDKARLAVELAARDHRIRELEALIDEPDDLEDCICVLKARLAEANAGRDKLIGHDVENNLRIEMRVTSHTSKGVEGA